VQPSSKPLVPPRKLLDGLIRDLETQARAIASQPCLSTRQKRDRYLEHVKKFSAAWLVWLFAQRKSTARMAGRTIDRAIDQILTAVTHTASLSSVLVPPYVVPLGLTADGNIAPPEYPDRLAEMNRARHLVEFPPAHWEDQRQEAVRWGDRDPARWGDEPPPVDDPRPMAERMAEWEGQVADYVRQEALGRKAAREIYRPHGVFEQAMPSNTPLDRISFRSEAEYIERTLRHDLMSIRERLLLDHARLGSKGQPMMDSSKAPQRPRRGERHGSTRRGRPLQRKRTAAQTRRSKQVHDECDPALNFLGWTAHEWADKTDGEVGHSAIDRLFNGETIRMRAPNRRALFQVMEQELTKHNRRDLLMTSPRWAGELHPVHPPAPLPQKT
jgi:hypothetical protein